MKNFQKFFYYNDYVFFFGTKLDMTETINYNFKELKKNQLL